MEIDGTIQGEYSEMLKTANLLGEDHLLNTAGLEFLAHLLRQRLPRRHGPAFEAIKRAAGQMTAVECVIVHKKKGVLLAWREHPVFGKGWHTPGTYPNSFAGETHEQALVRCARTETDIEIYPVKQICTRDHWDNPRFPDAPVLYLCKVLSGKPPHLIEATQEPKPNDCAWFQVCPIAMLEVQEGYRPYINEAIRESRG